MNISVAALKQKLSEQKGVHLIDVREELEYHTFNIGGENIPLGRLPAGIEDLELERTDEIVVICQRGLRSETARRILAAAGYLNVRNLEGGLLAYRKLAET
ncbi:MAG: rhodanese-like protein [Sphingobacteriaceae bacterium]|jgi:rhodanese-related sulfurtransferase|nr:rhodanese-like protein [Sphingobacteriaceae bacterium]